MSELSVISFCEKVKVNCVSYAVQWMWLKFTDATVNVIKHCH